MAKPTQISLFDLDSAESAKPTEPALEPVSTVSDSNVFQVVEEPTPAPIAKPDIPERAPRPPKVIMVEVPDPEPATAVPELTVEPVDIVDIPTAVEPRIELEQGYSSNEPDAPHDAGLPTFVVPVLEPSQAEARSANAPAQVVSPARFRLSKRDTPTIKSTRGRKPILDDGPVEPIDVPEDDVLFQKLYYPIGQVAEMFKVNASLIRLWENEFDILKPRKNGKGDRLFRPEDIKNLKLIHHLIREKKYTMAGAKDYLKRHKAAETRFALIESLQKLQAFLRELKAGL